MASSTNKVRFGASRVMYALETDGVIASTWTPLAGAVQISFTPQNDSNTFYADNMGYYMTSGAASDEFSIELADMTDQAKQDILGFIVDDVSGLFIEPVNATHKTFAMGYQVEGDGNILRLHLGDVLQILSCNFGHPDVVDAHLRVLDQVDEQVEGPFEDVQFYFICHRRLLLPGQFGDDGGSIVHSAVAAAAHPA